ncbi:MAG: ABC transporter permease [Chloroflexota bacterium]|nr:ABC transporter permease [Chloroflexota bacterium]
MKQLNFSYLIIQNLKRKPYRTVAIALCVMIATGTLFTATIMMRGVQNSLDVGLARLGADLIVVPQGQQVSAQEAFIVGQPTTFYMDAQVEPRVRTLPGVARASAQVFVQTLRNASCCIGEFFLVSFDPNTDFTISPWLSARLGGRKLRADEIIVGDRILLHPGETAIFYGTPFTVADELESTGLGLDRTVFMPIDSMRQMIAASPARAEKPLTIAPNQISAVLVQAQPGSNPKDVAEAIEQQIAGVQAFTASQMNLAISQQFSGLFGIILGVTVGLWLMSLIVIALVFSLIVNERQREIGLLRAMGARQGFIFCMLVGEATLLTGLAGAIGLAVSVVLLVGFEGRFEQQLHIPFLWPNALEAITLIGLLMGLALVSGAAAASQPARRISRLEPYEAIRQGE